MPPDTQVAGAMTAVIRTTEGRPAVVTRDGWTVYVSVRDAAYLQGKREWRQTLVAAHPDKGGSHAAFLEARRGFDRWRATAAHAYQLLGLLPPDGWTSTHQGPPGLRRQALPRMELICQMCGGLFLACPAARRSMFCSAICYRKRPGYGNVPRSARRAR